MRLLLLIVLLFEASTAVAEALVPTRTIRAHTILTAEDLAINKSMTGYGLVDPRDAIGMEARVVLYVGRPIHRDDLAPPAIVRRNQLVSIVYVQDGLQITTIGRALDRGAAGDLVQVMNVSSRSSIFGTVMKDGSISVSYD